MAKRPVGPATPQQEALRRLVQDYIINPHRVYGGSNEDVDKAFRQAKQFVPKGLEVYRAPSDYDMQRLPSQVGQQFRPNKITSFIGSSDLQDLIKILTGEEGFKMSQGSPRANALMKITAMENIPGAMNVNRLADYAPSRFNEEGLFGPKTRYEVQGITPATRNTPAIYNLGAYANMGLGAANILGMLPLLMEAGNIMSGQSQTFNNVRSTK